MTLTLSQGPLAAKPVETANYTIEGPKQRLLLDAFPRRIRAVFGGETVLDTERGQLLHETGYLPQLYVPERDVRTDLFTPTDHTTRCPYKGDASYWSLTVDGRVAENAAWAYLTPNEEASWLRGYLALYFDSVDAWFDEDEEITGHVRDPYHRVDVRSSSRHVRILVAGQVVAESRRPKVLSETGLPNRYYLPRADVDPGVLQPSATHTHCPYKGTASYYTLDVKDQRYADAAWFYPEPLEEAAKVADHLCFLGDGIDVEVDGTLVA